MTSLKVRCSATLLAVCAARLGGAQANGRSHEHLGTVHFATSCTPAVSPTFDRGVALLHSFEFGAAIQSFTAVLSQDSSCAMAHWGIALSRWGNPMAPGERSAVQLEQGRVAASAAARVGTHATERERAYIAAVARLYAEYEHSNQQARVKAYEHAMRALAAAQPADTEAKIFHAIALVASASPNDKTYAAQLELERPTRALAEYRVTMKKEPNRYRALYGAMKAASAAGDGASAKKYAAAIETLTGSAAFAR